MAPMAYVDSELVQLEHAAALASITSNLMCALRFDGGVEWLNPAWVRALGWSEEELTEAPLIDLVHPDDQRKAQEALAELTGGVSELVDGLETRWRRRDGSYAWLCWTVEADPERELLLAVGHDIGKRREVEQAMREAQERFSNAFENAPIGMALIAVDHGRTGRLLHVNTSLVRMLGRDGEQLCATTLEQLTPSSEEPEGGATRFLEELRDGVIDVYDGERRFTRSHEVLAVSTRASLVRGTDGEPLYAIAQFQDITERKRFEQDMAYLADHDSLTGLYNRRRFEVELEREIGLTNRHRRDVAVLLVDIDHFKLVNDTMGHRAGDQLIARVAAVLRRRLRTTDVAARLGGDEFAILLPSTGAEGAAAVAEQIAATVRAESASSWLTFIPMENGEASQRTEISVSGPPRVTVSVGVAAMAPGVRPSAEELLSQADNAMYEAKEAGRDGVRLLDVPVTPPGAARRRVSWYDRIQHAAAADDRFTLYCQPILELASQEVTQFELLLRLVEDDRVVSPGQFLPLAERYGLIQEIDRWVVCRAIRLMAEHEQAGCPIRLGVNLSGKSMSDDRLPMVIERELDTTGIDPSNLSFEVTETAAIVNIGEARRFAHWARDRGVGFALDDFGAGFGSFYYLKHLPFDYLKIDGDFVKELVSGRTDQLVVRAVVDIARQLGKRTIAEYVEDQPTLDWLAAHGVDYAQGFYIDHPRPVVEMWPHLESASPLA